MRRPGSLSSMQRVQRKPSYAETVLAMKPTFVQISYQPGGRADVAASGIDVTGRGKTRVEVSGSQVPANLKLTPGGSPVWWFDGGGMWNWDSTDYVIWHPYGPWAWSFWCQPYTNADETRSCPIAISAGNAGYSWVGAMVRLTQTTNTAPIDFHVTAVPDGNQSNGPGTPTIYPSGVPRGKPYHIAVRKLATGGSPFGKEGPCEMAINGKIIPGAPNLNVDHNMYRFTIGGANPGFWREFTGHIWDVACWAWNVPTMEQLCRLYTLGCGGSANYDAS